MGLLLHLDHKQCCALTSLGPCTAMTGWILTHHHGYDSVLLAAQQSAYSRIRYLGTVQQQRMVDNRCMAFGTMISFCQP